LNGRRWDAVGDHGERLALGMQGLATSPSNAAALQCRLDQVDLVLLGDRWL
jgi:hypothetical protein